MSKKYEVQFLETMIEGTQGMVDSARQNRKQDAVHAKIFTKLVNFLYDLKDDYEEDDEDEDDDA